MWNRVLVIGIAAGVVAAAAAAACGQHHRGHDKTRHADRFAPSVQAHETPDPPYLSDLSGLQKS